MDWFTYVRDEARYEFEIDAATGDKLHDETEAIKYVSAAFMDVENLRG